MIRRRKNSTHHPQPRHQRRRQVIPETSGRKERPLRHARENGTKRSGEREEHRKLALRGEAFKRRAKAITIGTEKPQRSPTIIQGSHTNDSDRLPGALLVVGVYSHLGRLRVIVRSPRPLTPLHDTARHYLVGAINPAAKASTHNAHTAQPPSNKAEEGKTRTHAHEKKRGVSKIDHQTFANDFE